MHAKATDRDSKDSGAVLRALLLTDLVDSTRLIEELGDRRAFELFGRHDGFARRLLLEFGGLEIDKTDGFLMLFDRPVDALRYAIAYHRDLAGLGHELELELGARAGIHLGEVYTRANTPEAVARGAKPLEVEGLAKPAAARIMSLAGARQTLLTRGAFDLARRAAVDTELSKQKLVWLDHGPYAFKGIGEPVRVFEVGVEGFAPLNPPPDSAKAHRVESSSERRKTPPVGAKPHAAVDVAPGIRLGRYQIVDRIGAGGMGEVFRAIDDELDREVAVKVLLAEQVADPDRLKRFRREAHAVARLSHPNILEIFDIGQEGATPFVVTELLEGHDLRAEIGGRALPWQQVVKLALPAARALAAAHGGGVVHRDLKPENIFCILDGRLKVLDFGLARLLHPAHTYSALRANRPREALEASAAYRVKTAERVVTSGFWMSWLVMQAHHQLGQYERELAHSREATSVYPDVISLRRGEVRALAAVDRLDEIGAVIEGSFSVAGHRGYSTYTGTPGALMVHAALALRRHGHREDAISMATKAVAWYTKHPQQGAFPAETARLRADQVWASLLAGHLEQAGELAAAIAEDIPEELLVADAVIEGQRGVIAALAGDHEGARAFDRELATMEGRFRGGAHLHQRARIHAVLGETEAAIELLQDAFAAGHEHGIEFHMDPALESLRELPAYDSLVATEH